MTNTSVKSAIEAFQARGETGYIRFEPEGMTPGEILPASRRWEDGELTGDLLPGTSAIDPSERLSRSTLESLYPGVAYLIDGERVGAGEDEGEVILASATVIAQL